MKPLTQETGCDTVLSGQGYGRVWSKVEMMTTRGKPKKV